METATIAPPHSPAMQELDALFGTLGTPCGQGDVVRFNLAYQRLYPRLSGSEKLRAERLVDALLADLVMKADPPGRSRPRDGTMKHGPASRRRRAPMRHRPLDRG